MTGGRHDWTGGGRERERRGGTGCSSLPDRTRYSRKPDVTRRHLLERTLRHEQHLCNLSTRRVSYITHTRRERDAEEQRNARVHRLRTVRKIVTSNPTLRLRSVPPCPLSSSKMETEATAAISTAYSLNDTASHSLTQLSSLLRSSLVLELLDVKTPPHYKCDISPS